MKNLQNHQAKSAYTAYNFHLLGLLIFCLFGVACSPAYFPQVANTPMYKEGGQGKVLAALNGQSFDVQGSVAVSDNIAIIGGFNTFNVDSTSVTTNNSTNFYGGSKGVQFDIAPGYYTNFNGNGVFEVFGGYGYGQITSDDIDGNINKFFLQPSVGINNGTIEAAFTLRYTHITAGADALINSNEDESVGFIEPTATFRIGGPALKFHSQFGLIYPTKENFAFEAKRSMLSIGVQYNFGAKE